MTVADSTVVVMSSRVVDWCGWLILALFVLLFLTFLASKLSKF